MVELVDASFKQHRNAGFFHELFRGTQWIDP